jgi:AraC-like DNA-binding protein
MKFDSQTLHLLALFDHLGDEVQVWIKDRQGRYGWVNRAFLLKYALAQPPKSGEDAAPSIVGKTDYDLSPAVLAEQYRLDDEEVFAGRSVLNRIEPVTDSNGGLRWSVTNKIPLFDGSNAVTGAAGITRPLAAPPSEAAGLPLAPVLEYIRDHYAEPVTNARLAKLAQLSVRAFERKFRDCFHLTPQKYLRRLRLRIASRALVFSPQSIAAIAHSCGFVDQSHFSREFRRQFGGTPRGYRKHYGRRGGMDEALPKTGVGK